ncbi:MAG: S8 family serine peptidase [Fulvivirga sp.]
MVFFSDKNGSSYSVDNPEQFLSSKAITRRTNQGIAITELDLPVNDSYIQGVKDLDVDVFFLSKWFNAALIQTEANKIASVTDLSYVDSVLYIAPDAKLSFGARKSNKEEKELGRTSAENNLQSKMLGVNTLQSEGFDGAGVSIAVLDAGFTGVDTENGFSDVFNGNKLKFVFNFVENNEEVYKISTHGTRVFSTMAASIDNEYRGIAVQADYMLFVTEDAPTEYRIEEYNWLIAAEKADSAGVDIITSSLGYNTFDDPAMDYVYEDLDGETTIITQAANIATSKGILVVVSAGNMGNDPWQFITAPADARDILAVGSVNINGSISSFSSLGPAADGRIKPDIAALGSGAVLVSNGGVTTGNGTSFASPQVAGLAALLWQANPTLSNLELRELILSIGSQSENPDNNLGYGIPNYNQTLALPTESTQQLVVYPNPVVGNSINIGHKGLSFSNAIVTVMSATGQIIIKQTWGSGQELNQLSIAGLKKGVYQLVIHNSDQIYKTRFVKY